MCDDFDGLSPEEEAWEAWDRQRFACWSVLERVSDAIDRAKRGYAHVHSDPMLATYMRWFAAKLFSQAVSDFIDLRSRVVDSRVRAHFDAVLADSGDRWALSIEHAEAFLADASLVYQALDHIGYPTPPET